MMKGNERPAGHLKVAVSSLGHCFRAHPPLFIALMAVSALLCAIEVGELYAMRGLFDAAQGYIDGRLAMDGVIRAAWPMAALLVLSPIAAILEYLGQGYFWRRGSGYLMARYHERIQRIPLIDFEKADTFDRMKNAQLGSEDAPAASRNIIQFAFHFIPYLILTAAFLYSVKPLLVLALLILFASVVIAQVLRAGMMRRFEQENAGLRRQTEYFEGCITGKETLKETRTLGAVGFFFALFMDAMRRFNRAAMGTARRIARVELLLRAVNVLGYVGILGMLVNYLLQGGISVGAFASVFYSVKRISGVLQTMVDQFGEALAEMSTASFTHAFLQVGKEEGEAGPLDKQVDIHLKGVSFAYPGGKTVLDGLDLDIARGETLAIVGENGAGKTTLKKLIIGLYRPTSGTVEYGGKDLNGYASRARFARISSVFQHFMRYKLTARENIAISDVGASTGVEGAANTAGANLENLPQGLDTLLSREFDGTELSGGQWQRIAIARGLYRAHDVIVLDEPTAAIDPIEESRIFHLFKASAQGKTAILVTHRLGSTKIADRILMLEDGKICELGTHAQLMAAGGPYAKMYREQASWYER